MIQHDVKRGDQRRLRWRLNADLTDVIAVRIVAVRRHDQADIDAAAVVDSADPDTGLSVVSYVFTSLSSAETGHWDVEFITTWADGQEITFPDRGWGTIVVTPDLS